MRLLFFQLLVCIALGMLQGCSKDKQKQKYPPVPDVDKSQFVRIQNNHFVLNDSGFFPVMLNYIPEFRRLNGELVLGPFRNYETVGSYESSHPDSVHRQVQGHLGLIRQMGFNSIRLALDRVQVIDKAFHYKSPGGSFSLQTDRAELLKALEAFLAHCEQADLKVMLLLRRPLEKPLQAFTKAVFQHFQANPTLFAYDLFNEPLYFDPDKQRSKTEAVEILAEWRRMQKGYAPYQLLTLGLTEPIEVFEWDPSLLPIDFIAFHTYHPLRVPNEIYWYANYANKPWMIGETGLPADNDSISYAMQTQFVEAVYEQVRDCGGMGIGFWQFQEEPGTHFEAAHTGVLTREGETMAPNGYRIKGTPKPMARELRKLDTQKKQRPQEGTCPRPVNYQNMLGYQYLVIRGQLVDEDTGQPIEGGLIRGWNEDWSVGMNTYSMEDGSFALYSNDINTHFEISAPGYEKLKFKRVPDYETIHDSQLPLEEREWPIPERTLEYHDIHFQPFLNSDSSGNLPPIFDFRPGAFNNAEYEAQFSPIELAPITSLPENPS